jgi:hypothetical protein
VLSSKGECPYIISLARIEVRLMLELIVTRNDSSIFRADDLCNALHEFVELVQACVWR